MLPKGDPSFTSCILVHGMGGTGKTVTAVAVLQHVSVRQHFSDVYWLTVGADAVGERMKELMGIFLKQLTGKSLSRAKQPRHMTLASYCGNAGSKVSSKSRCTASLKKCRKFRLPRRRRRTWTNLSISSS